VESCGGIMIVVAAAAAAAAVNSTQNVMYLTIQ
jgi:hypothetical protein